MVTLEVLEGWLNIPSEDERLEFKLMGEYWYLKCQPVRRDNP
ncbi:MAG: hypothetical protein AB4063_20590 [Crocosphaera sp.]